MTARQRLQTAIKEAREALKDAKLAEEAAYRKAHKLAVQRQNAEAELAIAKKNAEKKPEDMTELELAKHAVKEAKRLYNEFRDWNVTKPNHNGENDHHNIYVNTTSWKLSEQVALAEAALIALQEARRNK